MTDPARLITDRLTAEGWTRTASAEQLDWPTFQYANEEADLVVEYFPGKDWLRFGLTTEDLEGNLKVCFEERLAQVLDTVTSVQDDLGPDQWSEFIDQLLAIPVRTFAITGEDESDLVELQPSE